MTASDTVLSGAFGIDDTTGILAFIDDSSNILSGQTIFTWQDLENRGVYVGITTSTI